MALGGTTGAGGVRGERKARSLTVHLAVFAASLLLPILIIAGALVGRFAVVERERYGDIVRDGGRDLAALLDRDLLGTASMLRALALSDHLDRNDLAAFHRHAEALGQRLGGLRFVLGDADGTVRLDTARPYGEPLPPGPDPALAPGQPLDGADALAVSDLIPGGGAGDLRFAVVIGTEGLPGSGLARLAAVRPVAQLQRLFDRDNLPEGATASIFDRALTLAARMDDASAYLGQPPSEAFARTAGTRSGVWTGAAKDGTEILAGYTTSRLSGWRTTVGLPRSVVAAPTRRSLAFFVVSGLAMVLACVLAGVLFGGRIARPIAALRAAALDVGQGRTVAPAPSGILEVDAVADALAAASAERAARQARLVENEERLRLALEAGGLGSWDLDLVSGKRLFSERSAAILGVDAADFAERAAWTRFVHPDDQDDARAALAAAIEGGASYNIEFRVRPPDGPERWVASQAIVLRDEAGRASRIIGIHRDVTQRRRMEEALRASEERLRATQEQASVGIAEVDGEGRYVAVNEAFIGITGYPREALTGRSLFSLSPPEDARADRERYARLVSGREPEPYALEKRFLRGDGSPGWIAVSASAVRDARGRFLYGVRVVQDITARRLAEESRELLVHELNHRVKNTLATVQSVAMQSFRDVADRDARGLFESRLLALSKAHDVLTREDWRGAGLREVVAEALAPYRGEDSGDRFDVNGPSVRLLPRTALSIAMALHELATNAAKYGALTAAGGRVTVAWSVTRRPGGRRLRLRWEEAGGPTVAAPRRRGFGSRLIERGLAAELDGEVELVFAPSGVVCRIDVPLETGPRAAPTRAAA